LRQPEVLHIAVQVRGEIINMDWKRRLVQMCVVALAALCVGLPLLLTTVRAESEGERTVMAQERLPAGVTKVTEADGIREYKLANGMKVLLVENRVAPVATVMVLYRVGSRNEAVGYTGATHLLEHMMFKGTPTFNSAKNTQIAATLQKLGADFNATTWYDRTNYFETIPSDQIELAIRLEADRMRNSLIADADRQSEMTVVRNGLSRASLSSSDHRLAHGCRRRPDIAPQGFLRHLLSSEQRDRDSRRRF
jgi:hypothetical protein